MVVERWQGLFLGSEWLLWKTRLCLHWRLGVFFSFDTLQSCVVSNDWVGSQSALYTLNHDDITLRRTFSVRTELAVHMLVSNCSN
jgi:hypothetical protein